MENYNNQKEESIDEKFNKMRAEMLELISQQKPRKKFD